MKTNYMIAVCDILGFERLVETQPLDAVVDNAIGWFRKALYYSLHKDGFPGSVPELQELEAHPDVGVAWFSDTVLLYTLRDDETCVRNLISTVGWLLFLTIVEGRTRIRGGISYGEAYINSKNSLFVGTPIIEAYRLEQSQQWAGAALTKAAVERIPEVARSGRFADWWIIPYPVPVKEGTLDTLAVKWTLGDHHPSWKQVWSDSREEPNDSDWAKQPDVCEKFINTKAFHDLTCTWCNKSPRRVG